MTLRKPGVRESGLRRLSVGAIGSDLVHIETQVASGDSTIDFTNVFTSDYDRYVLFADNVVSDSGDGPSLLSGQFSSDGGSTWDSGSSDYAYAGFRVNENGTTSTRSSAGLDKIRPLMAHFNDSPSANDTAGGSIVISGPADSNRATAVRSNGVGYRSDNTYEFVSGIYGGIRLTQSAIDSIRLLNGTGGNLNGIFSVYGVDQ